MYDGLTGRMNNSPPRFQGRSATAVAHPTTSASSHPRSVSGKKASSCMFGDAQRYQHRLEQDNRIPPSASGGHRRVSRKNSSSLSSHPPTPHTLTSPGNLPGFQMENPKAILGWSRVLQISQKETPDGEKPKEKMESHGHEPDENMCGMALGGGRQSTR